MMNVPDIYTCYSRPVHIYDYDKLREHPLIDPTQIGLKGSPTNIFKSFTPPFKGQGMILHGSDKETAAELASILSKKHLV